jgi:hypothetical protein
LKLCASVALVRQQLLRSVALSQLCRQWRQQRLQLSVSLSAPLRLWLDRWFAVAWLALQLAQLRVLFLASGEAKRAPVAKRRFAVLVLALHLVVRSGLPCQLFRLVFAQPGKTSKADRLARSLALLAFQAMQPALFAPPWRTMIWQQPQPLSSVQALPRCWQTLGLAHSAF